MASHRFFVCSQKPALMLYLQRKLLRTCAEKKEDVYKRQDQRDPDEKVVEIEIERLRDFKNHPFKVQADSQMKMCIRDR